MRFCRGKAFIRKEERKVDVARGVEKIEKGWRLGDPVNKLTRAGKYPEYIWVSLSGTNKV
jgi:hypothetical protein